MKLLDVLPIFEARKNPTLNPKLSAYEQLKQYKDNPNIFIHMGTVNKVGLNVLSKYSTPLGIYTYPLKYVWNRYIEVQKSLYALPFMGDAPYVHILEFNGKGKFVNIDEYSDTDLNNDITKIKTLFKYDNDAYAKFMKIMNQYVTNMDEIDVNNFEMNELRFGLSYGPELNKILTLVNNAKRKYYNNRFTSPKILDLLISDGIKFAKDNSPITKLWNITRFMANYGDDPDDLKHNLTVTSNGKYSYEVPPEQYHVTVDVARNWNSILRKLGYAGFNDRHGLKVIHPSEPIQAVFLSKQSVNHIGTILNKEYNIKDVKKFKIGKNNKQILSAYGVFDYIRSLLPDDDIEITKEQYKLLMTDPELVKLVADYLKIDGYIMPKSLRDLL
jgi:hypothetical protein